VRTLGTASIALGGREGGGMVNQEYFGLSTGGTIGPSERRPLAKYVVAVAIVCGGLADRRESFQHLLTAVCVVICLAGLLLSGCIALLSHRRAAIAPGRRSPTAHDDLFCPDKNSALKRNGSIVRRRQRQRLHCGCDPTHNANDLHPKRSTMQYDTVGKDKWNNEQETTTTITTTARAQNKMRQTLGSWHADKIGCRSSSRRSYALKEADTDPSSDDEILHVEDDAVQRAAVRRILTREGFRVVGVESAEEAFEFFRERHATGGSAAFPSVVLMDVGLPGASGLEAVRTLRQAYPDAVLPVIMITATDDEGVLCEALGAGCSDYTVKPLLRQSLLARIRVQLHVRDVWRFQLASRESEGLLKQILPQSIIARLLRGESRISDALPEVSVLFTEIVGFEGLQSSCGVKDTIKVLNRMFRAFDDLTDLHRVYKVETVGDTYMCVAGHEKNNNDDNVNQVERLVTLARDLLKASARIRLPSGEPLQLRVGIHTGPAYSGVVGHKCPRFCFFGDTVNTASRMKSTSDPGCVQLSDSSYQRLVHERKPTIPVLMCNTPHSPALNTKDNNKTGPLVVDDGPLLLPGFHTQCMGYRPIKGKGLMRTWMLHPVPQTVVTAATAAASPFLATSRRGTASSYM